MSQTNQFRVGHIEIGIVFGDDRIMHGRIRELHGALHTAGDNGIRIHHAARCVGLGNSRRALRQEKWRHIRCCRDYRTVVSSPAMKDHPRSDHAGNHDAGENRYH
jgi:hypothetical protein